MSHIAEYPRARAVLASVKLLPVTRAASGRYLRSPPFRPGLRYWATSKPRLREDALGVQFYGAGVQEAGRYSADLVRAGFLRHRDQTNQITFAKPIPYTPDDELDIGEIAAAKQLLDQILQPEAKGLDGRSFRDFMLASPWAGIELDLPARRVDPERLLDL